MNFDNELNEALSQNFNLLCNVIRQSGNIDMKVDLSKIEKIINNKIPDTLKKNAPPDYYELYVDFKYQYEKFKEYILYDELIGKNIIALGGGFSSGKSSFLNAINGESALPEDIEPSTSVPTYIVHGKEHKVMGINIFDNKVEISTKDIKKIAHGFGEIEDDEGDIVVNHTTLGHVLESIFLSTPKQIYENVVFLDTPGYSKPGSEKYSFKTDEQIARRQLNSSNYILWFVQADEGTITEADIEFIKTLRDDIPKLIILNKSDKKPLSEIEKIRAKIKETLNLKGIRYIDVLTFSNIKPDEFHSSLIRQYLQQWNKGVYKSNFAKNFKFIFMRCKEFYEKEIDDNRRKLNRLNTAVTKITFADVEDSISDILQELIKQLKKEINSLLEIDEKLKELQKEFFTEIKFIGDVVGIEMPEPSEIDMIGSDVLNPLEVINRYKESHHIKTEQSIINMMEEAFENVKPVFNSLQGGCEYKNELTSTLQVLNRPVKFNFNKEQGGINYQDEISCVLRGLNR